MVELLGMMAEVVENLEHQLDNLVVIGEEEVVEVEQNMKEVVEHMMVEEVVVVELVDMMALVVVEVPEYQYTV